jgi:hypothetical protein
MTMISIELREQVLRRAAASRAPTRTEARRAAALTLAAALAVPALILALAGGPQPGGRPPGIMVATGILAAAVAAVASWLAVRRGGAMDGRPGRVLLALIAAVPPVLIAAKLGFGAAEGTLWAACPERPGFRCLGLFLALAAPPLAGYLWIARLRDVPRPRLMGAALGMAAGACAWALVELWCPVAYPTHILLGHVLPLALVAGAGMVWRVSR